MKTINTWSLVNRNGLALAYNMNTKQCLKLTDKEGSSTMASLKLLASLVKNMDRTEDILNIVILPRNLGGILRKENVYEWIANGNKTPNGTQLSDEYIALAKYISDMRSYLGSMNLVCKASQGNLVNKTEYENGVKVAWDLLDKIMAPNKQYKVQPTGNIKPAMPSISEEIDF
jgi:hypothetical protein